MEVPTNNNQVPLVNFVIAGTQKGGTSALDAYLRTHQDITMASFNEDTSLADAIRKEVHFFNDPDNFNGKVDYAIYHSRFDVGKNTVVGEATPSYMYWHVVPERIRQYNAQMKFIILLRNPIERAYSHWNMEKTRGWDSSASFRDALKKEMDLYKRGLAEQHFVYSFIDRGFYTEQLKRIWRLFPKEQTLVLKSDDLKHNVNTSLHQVADFLGISSFPILESKEVHSGSYTSKINQDDFNYLKDKFYYEIKDLERLLDWDCSDWIAEI